jgi:potassium-transporting ATPase potassium-binding subunit
MVWALPLLVLGITFVLAVPMGLYMAWIFDGRYRAPAWLRWCEMRVNTGEQNWKEYCLAFMLFNLVSLVAGFIILALQPFHPEFLNPEHKGMLAPTTIFHTVISFMTNTNQQHYVGEAAFSYGSQLLFVCWKQILSPVIGMAALLAIVRGLRGDKHMGNFYLDMWRGLVYWFVPICVIVGVMLIASGVPMTFAGSAKAMTVEPGVMGTDDAGANQPQAIARGPVAAIIAAKQFGTNGGGYFGVNSAHPYENPSDFSNLLTTVGIIFLPVASLVMFGKMLRNYRHAAVIFGVMLVLCLLTLGWAIGSDTLKPNPGLTGHPALTHSDGRPYRVRVQGPDGNLQAPVTVPQVVGLPVEQGLGNLEGKELRFGTSAGTTWATLTTNTSNGSVNCMHDSLNPLTVLTPLTGMWLNCIWGGVGVGLINLLIYLVVGVFLAGLMVGRTPEYLGKKVEAREMKLASLALLAHPLFILSTAGIFAASNWGIKSEANPAAHGFTEILYEFTSSSANNGSGCAGLGNSWGLNDPNANPSPPAAYSPQWDIACGLVMLFSRFIPIIAPIGLAASLATKKPTPFTAGTMRTDTITFGFVLLGTILLIGALLFLPGAVLGPIAEHLGPMPFGG